MWTFLVRHLKEFAVGFFLGGSASSRILFAGFTIRYSLVIELGVRLLATLVIAFLSGLVTVLAHDVYKYHLKEKLFKTKRNGTQKDEEKDSNLKKTG